MIKYLTILMAMSFFLSGCSAQNNSESRILYVLPDSVEVRLNEYILTQNLKTNYYAVLENIQRDTLQILLSRYSKGEKDNIEDWVFHTNRFIVVANQRIPLLFDYDYKFSTLDTTKLGVYGRRSPNITRLISINHSFRIKFTKFYIYWEIIISQ